MNNRPNETPFAVLHIPHASKTVPPEVRKSFALSDLELKTELIRMTDSYMDELFDFEHALANRIVFPVSRLVVDPERFVNDKDESMSRIGMGAVYRKTSDAQDLRKHLTNEKRSSLIERYYKPHHNKLTAAVDSALRIHGGCLIIDCHSFPSTPLPYEPDQSIDRPDICIGTDEFHTPVCLSNLAAALFRENGFRLEMNRPYSGTIVPEVHHRANPAVFSIMIEINRSLYMNEISGRRNQQFEPLRGRLQTILQLLIEKTASGDPPASPINDRKGDT